MGRIALLFPGQGAQRVGMGRDFWQGYPAARRAMERAGEVLGWDVARLCFEGPQEELDRTARSQPAMLAVSVAVLRAMEEELPEVVRRVEAAAGLSLGEYSALVAAGAMGFEEALRLVERRGQYMEAACREPRRRGGMVSVIGLDAEAVRALCRESGEEVVAANFNSPGQVVVSGTEAGLEKVSALASARGARRTIRLRVEGAFHSPLMASAQEKLAAELARVVVGQARFPVVANVSGQYVRAPEEIRQCLLQQVTSSVQWQPSMERLIADGFDTFYEVGEGEVLTGLMRRILAEKSASGFEVESLSSVAALQKIKGRARGEASPSAGCPDGEREGGGR